MPFSGIQQVVERWETTTHSSKPPPDWLTIPSFISLETLSCCLFVCLFAAGQQKHLLHSSLFYPNFNRLPPLPSYLIITSISLRSLTLEIHSREDTATIFLAGHAGLPHFKTQHGHGWLKRVDV